jgi:hypothetical protein
MKGVQRNLILVLLSLFLVACIPTGSIDNAVQTLDEMITELRSTSAAWEAIVRSGMRDLPADIQNRVDVSLQRAINALGTQVHCEIDIVRDMLAQELENIKATLTNQPPRTIAPRFCNAAPQNIELSTNPQSIVFAGYNFDENVNVVEVRRSGDRPVPATFVTRNSHYNITLNLGGNGLRLAPDAVRIVLRWQNQDIGAAAVILPTCERRTESIRTFEDGLTPIHSRGDRDFDDHGPRVTVRVRLFNVGDGVEYDIMMKAEEWENNRPKSDFTTADSLTRRRRINYRPPDGWEISRINTTATGTLVTVLSGNGDGNNQHFRPGNGPVRQFIIVGDTRGDEAGDRTRVIVQFTEIEITIQQTENCGG